MFFGAALLAGGFLVVMTGCSTLPPSSRSSYYPGARKTVDPVPFTRSQIRARLMAQFEEWKGTDYRLGGMSRRGVDCSGFVHLTFRDRLGLQLPRSTDALSETGNRISPQELAAGDLVLFKTGLFARHVGIYIGGRRFIHASASEGVALSRLSDKYWGPRFWMARRVASPAPSD